MKTIKNLILIGILITTIFLFGCQQALIENNTPTSTPNSTNIPNNAPLLHIFGEANIDAKVLEINEEETSVSINAKIIKIKDYTSLESKEILLEENEDIIIHFSGIGNVKEWKTNLISKDIFINLKIRCLDGRINSRDAFTKESCYWESNEWSITI